MAVIVVGGGGRDAGKTSVTAGIIAALPGLRWTALKVSSHWHGESGPAVIEEFDPLSPTDSGRYLAAGAVRAFWVRGELVEAMPRIRELLAEAENVLIESNGILRFLQPDIYLSVLDPAAEELKESAREFLERSDAVLVPAGFEGMALGKVVLAMQPPVYATAEVVEFVAKRLEMLS